MPWAFVNPNLRESLGKETGMVSVPVCVYEENGQFVAQLVGLPACRGSGETKELAVNKVKSQLIVGQPRGEIVWIPAEPASVHPCVGIFKDDPTLEEMLREIYAERDRQRDEVIALLDAEERAAAQTSPEQEKLAGQTRLG
jgi:hypothetical protein